MALMKNKKNSQDYKRNLLLAENRATGMLNLIIVVAIGAIAYTDKIVVARRTYQT